MSGGNASSDRPATNLEIEAKFYVSDLDLVAERLQELAASQLRPRQLERNWRFDLPDRSLSRAETVLRLREDTHATLTVKLPGSDPLERAEYEVQVADSTAAAEILEALGYQRVAFYEKHRTEYQLGPIAVMLDELPFGDFVELEGPSVDSLRPQAAALGLDWPRHTSHSYLTLFQQLRERLGLPFGDASFANFRAVAPVAAADLQLGDALVQPEPST